jgi:hypothetical protein
MYQGRKVVIELDAGRYRISRDGVEVDEAFTVGGAGYVPLLDIYPTVQKKPFAEIAVDLADLYVQARPIPTPPNIG